MRNSFCVFIISHGRPNKVITAKTLKRCGYPGPLYIVCDNEDKTVDEYVQNYGEKSVLVFDKLKYAGMVDSCDNFQNRRTTTHARNACFDLAKSLGYEFFLVLDDDYTSFAHNYDKAGTFKRSQMRAAETIFDAMIEFLNSDKRILSVCFIQGGDLIGGQNSSSISSGAFPFNKRKAMNSFFCKTDRRFWFFSRLNEDVNTYLHLGSIGAIFLSIPDVALNQMQTQANAGGMSDAYLSSGTYIKSFYTAMIGPSFTVAEFREQMGRIHHRISWNNAIPKIIDESFRK